MANKLSVVEYERPQDAGSYPMQVASLASGVIVEQTAVDFTAGSTQSAAFAATSTFLRIQPDTACWIKVGANPTAVNNVGARLAAGQTEYYFVRPGDKIAAVIAS